MLVKMSEPEKSELLLKLKEGETFGSFVEIESFLERVRKELFFPLKFYERRSVESHNKKVCYHYQMKISLISSMTFVVFILERFKAHRPRMAVAKCYYSLLSLRNSSRSWQRHSTEPKCDTIRLWFWLPGCL